MGRIFETRKATMFARYDRMAKAFTRCAREITIAVKAGGPDPDNNPQLRRAIQNSRAVNMPKDKVANAIKKALGPDSSDYEEAVYEGYAPHGIPILAVCATDNPTRTVANVRMHFNKCGGNLGDSGAVGFLFNKMGVFRLDPEGLDQEELELDLIDYGLEEMGETEGEKGEPQLLVRCAFEDFGPLQAAIEERKLEVTSSGVEYIPLAMTSLEDAQVDDVMKLVERLEADDDVQQVYHNLS